MRIAVWHGKFTEAKQALENMEADLVKKEYVSRFLEYDIALGWFHCLTSPAGDGARLVNR